MSETTTVTPTNTRRLSVQAKEIYGYPKATHTVRLSNGGAGPSGIFRALAEDYQAAYPNIASSVAWYQNISPMTLQALHHGTVDISLTYERDQEADAVARGWAPGPPKLVFHDHFMLVGPVSNPAGINEHDQPEEAFQKIIDHAKVNPTRRLFLSRDDDSATNIKERDIFQSLGVPLRREALPEWYATHRVFPADALCEADRDGLYLLVDHSCFGVLQKKLQATIAYVSGGDLLRNSCYCMLSKHAPESAKHFLAYMQSARGQDIIAHFGQDSYGKALFTAAEQLDFPQNHHEDVPN